LCRVLVPYWRTPDRKPHRPRNRRQTHDVSAPAATARSASRTGARYQKRQDRDPHDRTRKPRPPLSETAHHLSIAS
jgi:hypothetical protein